MMNANGVTNPSSNGGNSKQNQEMLAAMNENLDDRVQCQWCNRKFNEEAGKRHFPHCEEKFKKN